VALAKIADKAARFCTPNLSKLRRKCLDTVWGLISKILAISLFEKPFVVSRAISCSRGVSFSICASS
jgi:hypothetical protein